MNHCNNALSLRKNCFSYTLILLIHKKKIESNDLFQSRPYDRAFTTESLISVTLPYVIKLKKREDSAR